MKKITFSLLIYAAAVYIFIYKTKQFQNKNNIGCRIIDAFMNICEDSWVAWYSMGLRPPLNSLNIITIFINESMRVIKYFKLVILEYILWNPLSGTFKVISTNMDSINQKDCAIKIIVRLIWQTCEACVSPPRLVAISANHTHSNLLTLDKTYQQQ